MKEWRHSFILSHFILRKILWDKEKVASRSDYFWSRDVIFQFTRSKGIISKFLLQRQKRFSPRCLQHSFFHIKQTWNLLIYNIMLFSLIRLALDFAFGYNKWHQFPDYKVWKENKNGVSIAKRAVQSGARRHWGCVTYECLSWDGIWTLSYCLNAGI